MSLLKPKFITKFFDPSPRFAGGLILNALGYHILRIFVFQLSFGLRKKRKLSDPKAQKILDDVLKDGIAVIPNFFPQDIFEKIRKEYESLNLPVVNERAPRIVRQNVIGEGIKTVAPILEENLAKNPLINSVVAAAMRQDIDVIPSVAIEKGQFSESDLGSESTDKADNLHFDVSYPTVKCFMYLNDVDERNAAFSFVKGSQKMTWARIWMEYKMSVPFWLWSKEDQLKITPEVKRSFVDSHGMKIESMNGKANTVIIANTMGLHRRGDYSTTTSREMVFVNYRGLATSNIVKKKIKSLLHI